MSMPPIKALDTLNEATVILRNKIIEISKLSSEYVINALSVYGADLAKILEEIQYSIKTAGSNPENMVNDTLIVFEVRNNTSSSNNMIQKDVVYAAYTMHIIIYGEASEELSVKLKTGLLEIDTKCALREEGVHIMSISNIDAINEFKNSVLWQRRDFDIQFAFRR